MITLIATILLCSCACVAKIHELKMTPDLREAYVDGLTYSLMQDNTVIAFANCTFEEMRFITDMGIPYIDEDPIFYDTARVFSLGNRTIDVAWAASDDDAYGNYNLSRRISRPLTQSSFCILLDDIIDGRAVFSKFFAKHPGRTLYIGHGFISAAAKEKGVRFGHVFSSHGISSLWMYFKLRAKGFTHMIAETYNWKMDQMLKKVCALKPITKNLKELINAYDGDLNTMNRERLSEVIRQLDENPSILNDTRITYWMMRLSIFDLISFGYKVFRRQRQFKRNK